MQVQIPLLWALPHGQGHPKEICSVVRADHPIKAVKGIRQGGSAIGSHLAGLFSVRATTHHRLGGMCPNPLRRNAYPGASFLSTQEMVDNARILRHLYAGLIDIWPICCKSTLQISENHISRGVVVQVWMRIFLSKPAFIHV